MAATYIDIPLSGAYHREKSRKFDPRELINLYTLFSEDGKKPYAWTTTPGLRQRIEFENGTEVRQLYTFNNALYAVVSEYVYEIDTAFVATELGTITTVSGYVGMASNETQVILVDGSAGYIIESSVLTQITSPGFPGQPLDVEFQDQYFIVVEGDTNRFYVSAVGDGKQWDALNYDQTLSKPDTLIGVRQLHRELFLFGTDSIEVFADTGALDFPFQRQNNLLLEYGCAGAGSISAGFDRMLWLAKDREGLLNFMMTDGTRPVTISNRPIEVILEGFTSPEDCRAYLYEEEGALFYHASFTTDNVTLVYDINNNEWHQRQSGGNRHLTQCHAFFNGQHIVGQYNHRKIYEQSRNYYDENGETIYRKGIMRIFSDPNYRLFRVDRFRLDTRAGTGDDGEVTKPVGEKVNADPQVFLSYSVDGGYTYSSIMKRTVGRIGARLEMPTWESLGVMQSLVCQIEFYAAVPFDVLGSSLLYEVTGI